MTGLLATVIGLILNVRPIVATSKQRRGKVTPSSSTMRILEIIIGIILLGGAAWTMVKSYKDRGISSVVVLAFAVFLVSLGLLFVFGAFSAWFRDFRFGGQWIR